MIGLLSGCLALTPSVLVNAEEDQDIIINEEENQKVEETETDVKCIECKRRSLFSFETWVRLARSFTFCQFFGKNQNGNIQSIYDSMLEDMTNESCVVNNNGIWLNESVEITNNGIDFDKIVTPVRITITNGIVNREVR